MPLINLIRNFSGITEAFFNSMIASLTFTYGTNRTPVYEYKSNDEMDRAFRQKLDLNLYVFHNTEDTFVNEVKNKDYFKDYNLQYASIYGTYPAALKTALLFLKQQNIKKIIFLQDDVFSCIKDKKTYDDLLNFLKTTSLNYLNLEDSIKENTPTPLLTTDSFDVYDITTEYYVRKNVWAFDDSPYFADIDFALNEIYDDTYFSYPDIWSAEHYLNAKFHHKTIHRPLTNKQFFRRVNFIGQNDWNKENELKFLNENFLK